MLIFKTAAAKKIRNKDSLALGEIYLVRDGAYICQIDLKLESEKANRKPELAAAIALLLSEITLRPGDSINLAAAV